MRAALFACLVCGCANLPTISGGTCGNAVVEPPEDCDTFVSNAASVCLPRGAAGECHFDCRRQGDGAPPACPAGWGCGVQGICRPPTGAFEPAKEFEIGGAQALMAGDFDGDGRRDVVSLESLDIRGGTKLRFHYFDQSGVLDETRAFPKRLASPAITELSGDTRSDIVFSDDAFRVGVLLGQADRRSVPETVGSFHFPDTVVRIAFVLDGPIERATPIMGLATIDGVPGFYGPDRNGILRRRGVLPGPPETLAGDPASGDLIEDPLLSPCWEIVLGVRGALSLVVADTCVRDPATGAIVWREEAVQQTILLDPPAPIDAPVQLADVNGDGHLDVMVGAGGKAYVAYGDGRGVEAATPYALPSAAPPGPMASDLQMPIAAGDFTGDGVVDFVFPDHFMMSMPATGGGPPVYFPSHVNQAAPWTVARIADLNSNGKLDVVAASAGRLGIDFFNGTGSENLYEFSLPTSGPVRHLAVADLDGDLIGDLAFIEASASEAGRDSLAIAFGTPAGAPDTPTPVARLSHVDQLTAFSESGLGGLAVTYTETVDGASRGVLAVLGGTGDRLPFAGYELVDASGGPVFRAAALGVAVGRFTGAGSSGDALALSTGGSLGLDIYSFWLLPGPGIAPTTALPLAGGLDPRLRAARVDSLHVEVHVTAAAADLDGDGRDEALWAIPADEGTHCGLVVLGASAQGPADIVVRSTIVLDDPCPGAQLLPVDADADGRVDVALLTGAPGSPDRKLLVLWNEGAGGLTTSSVSTVSAGGDSPEQLTVLPATPFRPFAFAYVTAREAVLVSAAATPRAFEPARALAALNGGSGIVAADVDGDGIVDLALAASGNLTLLKAQLTP